LNCDNLSTGLFEYFEFAVPGALNAVGFGFVSRLRDLGNIHFGIKADFSAGAVEFEIIIFVFRILDIKVFTAT